MINQLIVLFWKQSFNNRCLHDVTWLHKMYSRKKAMMEKITSHGPFLLYMYGSANINNQALY